MGIGFDPRKEYVEIINLAAGNCGFSVYEQSIRLKGANTRITVKIESDTVISHADCERYSRELSRLLDENGTLPNYMLEVSSPGLNRKIRIPDELARFKGSPIKIIYENNGGKVAKGILKEVGADSITVFENDGKRDVMIPFGSIKSANLDF